MRMLLLTPGTGHFYCGSCLRDHSLGRALRNRGHEVVEVPLYLPRVLEDDEPDADVQMGGINMYLQQKSRLARFLPRWATNLLDRPSLLRFASRRGTMTDAAALGDMTLSMLRGEDGRQAKELDKLVAWATTIKSPDVVLLSNAMLAGAARQLRSTLRRPIVVTLQGEAPFLDALSSEHSEQAWSELADRSNDVDAFVAVSHHYGRLMTRRLGVEQNRVHVVWNGIDLEPFESRRRSSTTDIDGPTIGYLARLCADKGLATLVDAFIELKNRDRVPQLRLAVAGTMLGEDRPFLRQLERRLADAGLADDVVFRPNLERDEKIEFLHGLDVFSVPATYGESFGLYLLEAMACGVPVVQPRHAAFPEIVEATQGGVLCDADDTHSLADALECVLLDPTRAREIGRRGRDAVRRQFSADHMAASFEEVCLGVHRRHEVSESHAQDITP